MVVSTETRNWWTKPRAVILALAAAFALIVMLAANIDEIEEWLGASEPVPPSLSLRIGKVTRIDRNNVTAVLSYDKSGAARLHACRFWMDVGDLQTAGELPEFDIPRGPSGRQLPVIFGLGVVRAQHAKAATVTMSCDTVSSAAVTLDLRETVADKP